MHAMMVDNEMGGGLVDYCISRAMGRLWQSVSEYYMLVDNFI
jgi:hypothetical protein